VLWIIFLKTKKNDVVWGDALEGGKFKKCMLFNKNHKTHKTKISYDTGMFIYIGIDLH